MKNYIRNYSKTLLATQNIVKLFIMGNSLEYSILNFCHKIVFNKENDPKL